MRAWIKDALGSVKTKEQLQSFLHQMCEPHGKVDEVVCDAVEPRNLTCTIRMADRPAAASVADWFGTSMEEGGSVVVNYQAPADFRA